MAARPDNGDKKVGPFVDAERKARQRGENLLGMPAPDKPVHVEVTQWQTSFQKNEAVVKREQDITKREEQIKEATQVGKDCEDTADGLEASLRPRAVPVEREEERADQQKVDITKRQAEDHTQERDVNKRKAEVKEKIVEYKRMEKRHNDQLEELKVQEAYASHRENQLKHTEEEIASACDKLAEVRKELESEQKTLERIKAEIQKQVALLNELEESLAGLRSEKATIIRSQEECADRVKELDIRDKKLQDREDYYQKRCEEATRRQESPVRKQPHYMDADKRLHDTLAELSKVKQDLKLTEARALLAEEKCVQSDDNAYWLNADKKDLQEQLESKEELEEQLNQSKESEAATTQKLQAFEAQVAATKVALTQAEERRRAAAIDRDKLQAKIDKLNLVLVEAQKEAQKQAQSQEDLKAQLEQTRDNEKAAIERLQNLKIQLNQPKKNKEAAVELQHLEVEHEKLHNKLSSSEITITKKEHEVENLNGELRKQRASLNGLEAQLIRAKKSEDVAVTKLYGLEAEHKKLGKTLSSVEDTMALKRREVDRLEMVLKEREISLSKSKLQIEELTDVLETSKQENQENEELRQRFKDQDSLLRVRDDLIKSLRDAFEQQKCSILGLNGTIEKNKCTIASHTQTIDRLERTDDERIKNIRTLESNLKDMRTANAASAQAMKKLQDVNGKHYLELQALKKQFEIEMIAKETKCKARETSLNAEIRSRDKAIQEIVRKGRTEEQTTQDARNGAFKGLLSFICLDVLTLFADMLCDRHGIPRLPWVVYVRILALGAATLLALMAASDMSSRK